MDKNVRKNLFIALPLPEQIKNELLKLNKVFPSRRFSPNLHLTLFFIGPLSLSNYISDLASISADSFSLRLKCLGIFGNKILWAGIENSDPLLNLQKKITTCMTALGHISEKRPYRPHITLCRLKNPLSAAEEEAFNSIRPQGQWLADSFCLYESALYAHGSVHSCLKSFPLNKC